MAESPIQGYFVRLSGKMLLLDTKKENQSEHDQGKIIYRVAEFHFGEMTAQQHALSHNQVLAV